MRSAWRMLLAFAHATFSMHMHMPTYPHEPHTNTHTNPHMT